MSTVDSAQLDKMLSDAFAAASALYKERGFQRRVGWGKKPALVSVDLANAWTRPGNPFTCDQEKMDNEIIVTMAFIDGVVVEVKFIVADLAAKGILFAVCGNDDLKRARTNSALRASRVISLWMGISISKLYPVWA